MALLYEPHMQVLFPAPAFPPPALATHVFCIHAMFTTQDVIKTPFFMFNSKYDAWQLGNEFQSNWVSHVSPMFGYVWSRVGYPWVRSDSGSVTQGHTHPESLGDVLTRKPLPTYPSPTSEPVL